SYLLLPHWITKLPDYFFLWYLPETYQGSEHETLTCRPKVLIGGGHWLCARGSCVRAPCFLCLRACVCVCVCVCVCATLRPLGPVKNGRRAVTAEGSLGTA
ncbi:hypothetical protein DFH27DRAFT_651337, partial [Peziza echinospora]